EPLHLAALGKPPPPAEPQAQDRLRDRYLREFVDDELAQVLKEPAELLLEGLIVVGVEGADDRVRCEGRERLHCTADDGEAVLEVLDDALEELLKLPDLVVLALDRAFGT